MALRRKWGRQNREPETRAAHELRTTVLVGVQGKLASLGATRAPLDTACGPRCGARYAGKRSFRRLRGRKCPATGPNLRPDRPMWRPSFRADPAPQHVFSLSPLPTKSGN